VLTDLTIRSSLRGYRQTLWSGSGADEYMKGFATGYARGLRDAEVISAEKYADIFRWIDSWGEKIEEEELKECPI